MEIYLDPLLRDKGDKKHVQTHELCSAVYILLIQKATFSVGMVQLPNLSRKSTYLFQHPTLIKLEVSLIKLSVNSLI